jgi:hypothetical protein
MSEGRFLLPSSSDLGSGGGNGVLEEQGKERGSADQGERQLVERAKRDPEAFGRLYVTPVYRYVYERVRDRAHAEDVTADVFRRGLESIGRFQWNGKPFSAWLFGFARRAVADHFRRAGREVAGARFPCIFGKTESGNPFAIWICGGRWPICPKDRSGW